ncbi:cationic amino acid transporter 2-like [Plakobranchus ocellatus]|uniref:Cationic amino acid transporter 2-like n=1 Tax=Plakobranchus ocellatus TaxID=259542 RepID=A0AAV3YMQ5_9GAST|nr:cationic amino acid transporter 2-like [Plakobranchus ocellatus]
MFFFLPFNIEAYSAFAFLDSLDFHHVLIGKGRSTNLNLSVGTGVRTCHRSLDNRTRYSRIITMAAANFFRRLVRKKVLSNSDLETSSLNRCLSVVDLTFLGVGSTLGAGLYVVIGQVAKDTAGPSVVISFLVAAIASAMAGLCYAEFAARIPRAGSAYVYSYVTVGELMAFIIGWNLILEYVIGTASVARAWSSYFDSLIGDKISGFFREHMPIHVAQLSDYPDFFALGITLLLTVLLMVGVKESARFNNIFTGVNLLVVLYVTLCGLFKLKIHNWNLSEKEVPKGNGEGGFLPFGFSGTMAGAATCFYAFVGFDIVATTGEETKNPQRSIPIAIIVSLSIVFLSYSSVSAVVTLMCPYYLLDSNAALAQVFERVGWTVARYIISIGAICGLSTSLLGCMFPLPRILYAMGSDGVIFRFMGEIHPRFQTPVLGTALSGLFAGLMALIFDVSDLVDMMSIGTLLAYTLVSVSVLILRYECDANLRGGMNPDKTSNSNPSMASSVSQHANTSTFRLHNLILHESSEPTQITALVTKVAMAVLSMFIIALFWLSILSYDALRHAEPWAVSLCVILALGLALSALIIFLQPQNPARLPFKVPLVPWLPIVSVMVNIYLMLKLSTATWIRFGVWMIIGFLIYFTYGIRHAQSSDNVDPDAPSPEISLPSVGKPEEHRSTSASSGTSSFNEEDHLIAHDVLAKNKFS